MNIFANPNAYGRSFAMSAAALTSRLPNLVREKYFNVEGAFLVTGFDYCCCY